MQNKHHPSNQTQQPKKKKKRCNPNNHYNFIKWQIKPLNTTFSVTNTYNQQQEQSWEKWQNKITKYWNLELMRYQRWEEERCMDSGWAPWGRSNRHRHGDCLKKWKQLRLLQNVCCSTSVSLPSYPAKMFRYACTLYAANEG